MKDFYSLSRIERYAFPGACINYSEPPQFKNANNLWMMTIDGDWLAGVFLPSDVQSHAVIIHFYGHGENLHDVEWILNRYRRLGYSVLCFDYRGYGASRGRPGESAFYRDVLFAYDWLRENHPDLRILASGRSLGTAMATYLASKREIQGLVLMSAPSSMVDVVKHIFPPDEIIIEDALPFRFDNLKRIQEIQSPILFIHGHQDQLVPIAMARQLQNCLDGHCQFISIPDAGHDDLIAVGGKELWQQIKLFLKNCVGNSPYLKTGT